MAESISGQAKLRTWTVIAVLVYGYMLAPFMGAYAGGSDSSGYLNHARALARGSLQFRPLMVPSFSAGQSETAAYAPLGFKDTVNGSSLVPTYPVGLPLFVYAASFVTGWTHAANAVLLLHAMAGIVLTAVLARQFGLSVRNAWLAAFLMGTSPLYIYMATQAMSDVPALVWTTAAILAAWRSRHRQSYALVAGVAYAIAVLIRPTNALALPAIGFCFGTSWRRWLGFVIGGAPGAIVFSLHSHAAYGNYFTTGYGDETGLSMAWLPPTLRHYAAWLPILFTPLAGIALLLPALCAQRSLQALVLTVWIIAFAGFYAAYSCTHETWWYLRYILPCAAAIVIGALLASRKLGEQLPTKFRTPLYIASTLFAAGWAYYWNHRLETTRVAEGERAYPEAAEWLNRNLPANAVVTAMQHSGAVYHYTDLTLVRWDSLQPADFRRLADQLTALDRPLIAVLWPFEIEVQGALSRRMSYGRWERIGRIRDVSIFRWFPVGENAGRLRVKSPSSP